LQKAKDILLKRDFLAELKAKTTLQFLSTGHSAQTNSSVVGYNQHP